MAYSPVAAGETVVLATHDREDRAVVLCEGQWSHIARNHPEMADALTAIELAISDPDVIVKSDTEPCDPEGERVVNSRRATHARYSWLYVRVPIEYSEEGNWQVSQLGELRSHVPAVTAADSKLLHRRDKRAEAVPLDLESPFPAGRNRGGAREHGLGQYGPHRERTYTTDRC